MKVCCVEQSNTRLALTLDAHFLEKLTLDRSIFGFLHLPAGFDIGSAEITQSHSEKADDSAKITLELNPSFQ